MLQEVKHGLQSAGVRSLPKYERVTKNKKTSYKVSVLEILPPLTIYNYAGLKFPEDASFISLPENILEFNVCLLKYFLDYFVDGCQATLAIVYHLLAALFHQQVHCQKGKQPLTTEK